MTFLDGISRPKGARLLLAFSAYGHAVRRAETGASTMLIEDARYRKQCIENLEVSDVRNLGLGLKQRANLAKRLP